MKPVTEQIIEDFAICLLEKLGYEYLYAQTLLPIAAHPNPVGKVFIDWKNVFPDWNKVFIDWKNVFPDWNKVFVDWKNVFSDGDKVFIDWKNVFPDCNK